MKEQHPDQNPVVTIVNNQAVTTSLEVARYFGKEHKNVIRDIEKLECSEDFRRLNFEPSNYLNEQNKQQPMYKITRDGFTLLGMGFTGSVAMRFKESYIAAFNRMEEALQRIQREALIEETKKSALDFFRKGAALTALLQRRDSLEKVEQFYWLRVHGRLTHYEAAHVCCLEPQHADEIARTLREIGLALPVIQGQVRKEEMRRFFSEAVGGFLPSEVRAALADLRKEVSHE
jgi:Rha family phage regulatory protein